MILTELLPTSLRKELEREDCHMTHFHWPGRGQSPQLPAPDAARPRLHRDISSTKVLLEPLVNQQWRAKVTDYNFQQQLRTDAVYASPEVGHPYSQSLKMDIFSFGALLVEMFTAEFLEVSG